MRLDIVSKEGLPLIMPLCQDAHVETALSAMATIYFLLDDIRTREPALTDSLRTLVEALAAHANVRIRTMAAVLQQDYLQTAGSRQ